MTGQTASLARLPFGLLASVPLPSPAGLAGLHPGEAVHAGRLPPARQTTWVGGRLALRAAIAALGEPPPGPMLATPRGAPALPAGLVGSVSHKDDLAVALVARAEGAPGRTVGVDVESPRRLRQDIARHVLTPDEQAVVRGLDGAARDYEILRRFAAKEAIYKALDPWVGRFVSFQEVTILRHQERDLSAQLRLARGEGPLSVELWDGSDAGRILVAARVTDR
jgi:enterobactin synthetase component D